jgi:hypothetical protein
MDIVGMITKAAELLEQGTALYEQVRPSIDSITGPRPDGLDEAKARLDRALQRANTAHDNLDAAIRQRLGE